VAKHILIALVVACALVGFLIFGTEGPPQKEPGASWSAPVVESLDRVEITRDGEEIVLEMVTGGWRITTPFSASADAGLIDDIAELFDAEEPLHIGSEQAVDAGSLERRGFDSDVISVVLYEGGEVAANFAIGSNEETPSGATTTWVRPDGSETLYRLNRNLRRVFETELHDWRNEDILVLTEDQQNALSAVDIGYGETSLRLERDFEADVWSLTEPEGVEVDADLLQRYTRAVDTLRAEQFADDVSPDDAGTATPSHTVTLHIGETENYVVRVGNEFTSGEGEAAETLRYIQVDDGPVFAVRPRAARDFMKQIGDLRPREVLDLDRDEIDAISIADRDDPNLQLERNDPEGDEEATWRLRRPERIPELNVNEVRRLVSSVAELEANRFADEDVTTETAGLDAPVRVLTVSLTDDSEHVVEIGNPIRELEEGEDATDVDHFARVDGGDIFEIRDFKVRNLLKTLDELRPEEEEEEEEG